MTRSIRFSLLAIFALGLSACGGDAGTSTDTVAAEKQADAEERAFTPGSPGVTFTVDYDIVGTPIVGSPLSIDLRIDSPLGDEAIEVGYQIPDPSALIMEDTQPRVLTRAPQAGERIIRERVTVMPQREGRLFMNVRATRAGGDGSHTTVISIPIHVGSVDTGLIEHGELETSEEGETTRVLTSE
jgi:hypothetical protein